MELKLTNYKDRLNIDCIGNPPTGDWRMIKENGERKIVRDLRVQRNFIVEDFIRYVKKDFIPEYKRLLETIGVKLAGKKKIINGDLGDMYIYKLHHRRSIVYSVKVNGTYVGTESEKEKAIKLRDNYIKEQERKAA